MKNLIFMVMILISQICRASNLEADDIAKIGRRAAMESIVDKYNELQNLLKVKDYDRLDKHINVAEYSNSAPISLRIFVSQSMPLLSLRYYYKQAAKFGGSLVFKGLPNGSFKDLSNLVRQIEANQGENQGSMLIDDEAFSKFEVKNVPTIVLSFEQDCHFNEQCKLIFDKIAGNIGVQVALTEFAKTGGLALEARRLLSK